jgi:hypothetical protein
LWLYPVLRQRDAPPKVVARGVMQGVPQPISVPEESQLDPMSELQLEALAAQQPEPPDELESEQERSQEARLVRASLRQARERGPLVPGPPGSQAEPPRLMVLPQERA